MFKREYMISYNHSKGGNFGFGSFTFYCYGRPSFKKIEFLRQEFMYSNPELGNVVILSCFRV